MKTIFFTAAIFLICGISCTKKETTPSPMNTDTLTAADTVIAPVPVDTIATDSSAYKTDSANSIR